MSLKRIVMPAVLALPLVIHGGEVPGILAYHEGVAVGWCAVGPRETYDALERSRIMAPA